MNDSRPALLFASAHLPSRHSREAGQRIAYRHLAWLSEEYRVSLVSWYNTHEREDYDSSLSDLCTTVDLVPLSHSRRLINALQHPFTPPYVAIRQGRHFASIVERALVRDSTEVLWAEYSQLAGISGARRIPSVLVFHDVMSQLWERRAAAARGATRLLLSIEQRRLRRWETTHARDFSRVVTLSQKDRDMLSRDGIAAHAGYPALDVGEREQPADRRTSTPTVAFLGALSRDENDDGIRWFLGEIWPSVRTRMPNARLLIIGSNPSTRLQRTAAQEPNVELTGFVPDPTALLETAWVAVAPLRLGAGIKVKVLEYLARGTSVIATPVGAEGIEAGLDDGLTIADSEASFAAATLAVLADPRTAASRGARAAAWFKTEYMARRIDRAGVLRLAAEALKTDHAPEIGARLHERDAELLVRG
jgi:glycosyltransferase involved in cell wall biosynthesis